MEGSHHLLSESMDKNPKVIKVTIESFPHEDQELESLLVEHEELIQKELLKQGNLGVVVGKYSRIVTEFYIGDPL
jgi:hypothetical protein